MQVIITRTEQESGRHFNRKLASLLKGLPGTEKVRAELIEQSTQPIDLDKIAAAIDPSQLTITEDGQGNLIIWINSDAVTDAMDLMLDQYGIIVEIGVALYPIARLAKRLFKEFEAKCSEFGKRFQRKVNPLLGKQVPVKSGGFEGVPVCWREGFVEATRGDSAIIRLNASQTFVLAKQDGQLFYVDSPELERISQFFDSEIATEANGWDFAPKSE